MTIFGFWLVCYDSFATSSATYTVTLHGYVTYSYDGYAIISLRHMVTPPRPILAHAYIKLTQYKVSSVVYKQCK